MVLDVYEGQENDPEEPTDPNETRLALSWLFSSNGRLDFEDSKWTADFDGENGLEFRDEINETIAYLPPGASGDIMSGGDGSGADSTATYVTLDDETSSLENSQQHANLSGADLHDPADHGLAGAHHTATTLSDLNALIDDATLDGEGSSRPPEAHALGGSAHNADTLANLNSKISDAVLDDESSTRPPESHANGAHSEVFVFDGDGTQRRIWVIANGASDPDDATADDIIFEEEA